MKIGIYGGTFNPPHLGHMAAARTALDALKLDKLLLMPAAVPPHKMLPAGTMFYLQEKNEKMPDGAPGAHKVKQGDTSHSIAQEYGLKLKSLLKMNKLDKNQELTEGQYLRLR